MSDAVITDTPAPAAAPPSATVGFLAGDAAPATPAAEPAAVVPAPADIPVGVLSTPENVATRFLSKDVTGETGELNEGWTEGMEKLGLSRVAKFGAKYRTEEDFLKGLDNTLQFIGKKTGHLPPGDKATAEEIAEYRAQIGAPKESAEYAFKPKDMPEGLEWDAAQASKAEAILHKHHIPKAAAQELADYYGEVLKDTQSTAKANFEGKIAAKVADCEKTFREEWGASYDKRLADNKDYTKVLFGDETADPLMQDFLARPSVVRLIDRLRREDRGQIPAAGQAQGAGSSSPGQEAAELMKTNPGWASDPEVYGRITRLFELEADQRARRGV